MRSVLRTSRTKAQRAMAAGEGAEEAVKAAVQTMDKVATKGAIHRNKAARLKSRLMRKLNVAWRVQNAFGNRMFNKLPLCPPTLGDIKEGYTLPDTAPGKYASILHPQDSRLGHEQSGAG